MHKEERGIAKVPARITCVAAQYIIDQPKSAQIVTRNSQKSHYTGAISKMVPAQRIELIKSMRPIKDAQIM